ncbi:hypothetical protein H5119_13415 [Pseudoalteromonas sp. SG45-5]|uniref:DUF6174 domain-containing protein n=1 Tax=unclassified Pseudoalteromonas TaxID=194690 RepID=UPI0015FD0B75|nr:MULTISPECIES: DUF6174 domain-containing protein [unclassified Pseudoalteromonas]MBB1386525.1 hypothetical protein [Pseudoalteromonas sp. SG45-5]MBB1394521.1 hypothetical protein [Pseudoalteromonas sp. SG44-4]MBB1447108.1 hypothetical protein [Pseudoalteromonas sp. SG41-6]
MNFKLLMCTLSFSLLFACNDSSPDSQTTELTNLIGTNYQKWKNSNINTYAFTYHAPPSDCPATDALPPVEITIENNVITKLYIPELGESLELDSQVYPTIADVFENMLKSVEHIKGTPLFDKTFGYPISYETDISDLECDGYSITITSFM